MRAPTQLFTSSRIAAALGIDSQAMALRLRGSACSGTVKVDGKDAKGWSWSALDSSLRQELDQRAAGAGYSSGEQLLACATVDWMMVPDRDRQKAARLCRALRAATEARAAGLDRDTVSLRAQEGYRAEFGYTVKPETTDALLRRAVLLDAGADRFERLHLYLPEKCFLQASEVRKPVPELIDLHSPLIDDLSSVSEIANPTSSDRQFLLSAAYRHLRSLVEAHPEIPDGALKSSLVDWLWMRAPALASSRDALRKRFDRGLARWLQGGRNMDALVDRRTTRKAQQYHWCPDCLKKIHDAAVDYHGRVTLAYRELRKRGLLCEPCVATAKFDMRQNKSYLPRGLRRRVTPTPLTLAFARSPREAQLMGPHPERDYSDTRPGDVFVADDMTSNERVAVPRAGGRWEFYKVQMIAATDYASGYWLDFVAHFGHPYAWSVQALWLQLFADSPVGMARKGLYLEHGVFEAHIASQGTWENSFDGRVALDRYHVNLDEGGARELFDNLRVRRAKLPTAKTIEGDFGQFQSRASMLPGHAGFNERAAKHDRVQDFMQLCISGKAHPSEMGILTIDELVANYRRIMEESNQEPQNGRRCRGASPAELWAESISRCPLERLPESQRYVFSTHRCERVVKGHGIIIPKVDGYQDAAYYGHPRLAELEGQRVEVLHNALQPAFVSVRVSHQESFIVKRQMLPSFTATADQLKEAEAARWNHLNRAKLIAANVSHPLAFTIEREDKFPESQLEMGRQHNAASAEAKAGADGLRAEITELRRRATSYGLQLREDLDLSKPRIRLSVRMQLDNEDRKRGRRQEGTPV